MLRRIRLRLLCLLTVSLFPSLLHATQGPSVASVADARKVLDLSKFELVDHDGGPANQMIANLAYTAKGSVEEVTTKIQKSLTDNGFKVLEGAMITPAYSAVTLNKDGFHFNLMVMPDSATGLVRVTLSNTGNVDVKTLPTTADAVEGYSLPSSRMLTTTLSVEEARKVCRELLEAEGWQWFGDTQVSFFMRKNAVRLQVMVAAAPAQNGKSMIQYSTEQLSTELPLPANLQTIQYADVNGGTIVDSKSNVQTFVSELSDAMKSKNWNATTEQPVLVDFHNHLFFRSPDGELADCEYFEFEGLTRCRIKYMTAAQLEAENEAVRKTIEGKKAKGKENK